MSSSTQDRLYNLLPAIYRIRDAERGEPLRALLGIIQDEMNRVEEDIDNLYENWFIETCDEWVVPYIGDLLGVRPLHPLGEVGTYSHRPYVANTLAYRRRKGTAPLLEQLVRDVTGWPARVVEFFELLETTQHANHRRLHNLRTPDLRDTNALELLGGPLERAARTAEVRHIDNARGRYNISNIGLFLWRLQSYAMTRSTARRIEPIVDRRYTFHPLGYDAPLFNRPQTETEITHLADEINLPGILRRRPLYDELEAHRQALADGKTPASVYFSADTPVLQVYLDGAADPLPSEEILICDLSDWHNPPGQKTYTASNGATTVQAIRAAVDPLLGRLTLPIAGGAPSLVEVSYSYGFSADVGGGPYNRQTSIAQSLTRKVTWQVGVSKSATTAPGGGAIFTTLAEAVVAWNRDAAAAPPTQPLVGIVAIMDSRRYREELVGIAKIRIPAGAQLSIVAAEWPVVEDVSGVSGRQIGHLVPENLRPHLRGNIRVEGTAASTQTNPGELVLDGLLIEGHIEIRGGNLGKLRLSHCTLVPDKGGIGMVGPSTSNDQLQVELYRSICGPVSLLASVPGLSVMESIVDVGGTPGAAVQALGAATIIEASTLLGGMNVRSLEAGNSLLTGVVTVERRQTGCVRFCYSPEGSQTPRRYQCQPDLALEKNPGQEAAILSRLTPLFTSRRYGHHGYAQLRRACAGEIRIGAENGSEMGVFNHLKQPQREADLRAAMNEYLRFGLEAGLFFVT